MKTLEKKSHGGLRPNSGANAKGSGPVHSIRTQLGMTQKQFAEATGVGKRSIERAESSGNWPPSGLARKVITDFASARKIEIKNEA